MKIAIIGSMKFAHDMVQIKKELDALGHEAVIPVGTGPHLTDGDFVEDLEANLKFCIEEDVMRENFRQVAQNDAVLVLNKRRNDMDGYIGISALLEMGIAHYLGKKIFLYNPTPHFSEVRWAHEVAIMQPTVISGDLSKIQLS
jgi:hypothetical protein